MSETWVLYEAISGDILDRGSKHKMERLRDTSNNADDPYPHTLATARDGSEIRAIQRNIARRMSGNPPRDRTQD